MAAFRQRLFRQNSLNQHSPKFNNAKVSDFTVVTVAQCFRLYFILLHCELRDYSLNK